MASAEEYAAWIVKNKDKRGTPDFDKVSRAYEMAKSEMSQAAEAKPKGNILTGLGETALAMGTGAVAAPFGGIVGTLAAATPFLREGIGADLSQRIGSAGTYQPRTQMGEKITGAVAAPFEWLAGKADVAGQAVADVAGPLAGTVTNTAIQSLPLVAGKIAAKGAKAGVVADEAARAKLKAANTLVDQAATKAKDAEFSLPPAQVNPNAVNNVLQGLASEGKLFKTLSLKNQPLANTKIKNAFGLADDENLTPQTFSEIRKKAGEQYNAVRDIGEIVADDAYSAALKKITADAEVLQKNFPARGKPPILAEAKALDVKQFDSQAAIPVIKDLRETGDKFYRGGDKKLGGDYKKLADEVEHLIERNLVERGAPADIIANFRNARKLIAQTYTVEKHVGNDGNINIVGLSRELKKKPLEGEIRTVAELGANFPKVAQLPEKIGGIGSISPSWAGTSAILATIMSDPRGLAAMGIPPALRAVLASKPYQNMLVNPPTYGPSIMNRLGQFGANEPANQLLNVGGMSQADR